MFCNSRVICMGFILLSILNVVIARSIDSVNLSLPLSPNNEKQDIEEKNILEEALPRIAKWLRIHAETKDNGESEEERRKRYAEDCGGSGEGSLAWQTYDRNKPDHISFRDLYKNYYNVQPKRSFVKEKNEGSDYPVYGGGFSFNDFTKDYITDFINYKKLEDGEHRLAVRKKRGFGAIDDYDNDNDLTEWRRRADTTDASVIGGAQAAARKQKRPFAEDAKNYRKQPAYQRALSNSKICIDLDKPSILFKSVSNPSDIQQINRNTVEEIIQVDIPKDQHKRSAKRRFIKKKKFFL